MLGQMEPPRSAQQRKQDTLERLATDKDVWFATADPGGNPRPIYHHKAGRLGQREGFL